MAIGAIGSLSPISPSSYGQGGSFTPTSTASSLVAQQALVSAYSGFTASGGGLLPGTDSLTALAGQQSLAALVGGIYTTSLANGGASNPLSGLSATGSADASTSALLSGLGGGGLGGFSPASLSPGAALALQVYADKQGGTPTTLTAAGNATAAAFDPTQASSLPQLLEASQSASLNATLNLLG